jgi:8-oxo-dGTP pyrophosphatase MutT (NUDIX family)
MSVVAAKPASTVVVVRDQPGGLEVLLVRRNAKVAFMAGAHVFPGGRVDAGDSLADPSSCCDGMAALPQFADLSVAEEVSYRVAAIRELIEEAGVLVARAADGSGVSRDIALQVRAGLTAGEALATLAVQHNVRFALDDFVALAHWVTPEAEPRRYDTRFFLATLPEGQTAEHDAGEMTELRWVRPADAIADGQRGEMLLPPPTWTTLKQLVRHASLMDLYAWARARPIVRVQPQLLRDERQTMLTLPGDPMMPTMAGWEIPEDTRFVLEEGRGWKPVRVS